MGRLTTLRLSMGCVPTDLLTDVDIIDLRVPTDLHH